MTKKKFLCGLLCSTALAVGFSGCCNKPHARPEPTDDHGLWRRPLKIFIDEERVKTLAEMLDEKTIVMGHPRSDRAFWIGLANTPDGKKYLKNARNMKAKGVPPPPDQQLFLDDWENNTGNYFRALSPLFKGYLRRAVIAECMTDSGEFVPMIEESIRTLAATGSWNAAGGAKYYAEDPEEFTSGKRTDLDLQVQQIAMDFTKAYTLCGDKLSPEIRQLIVDTLRKRIFEPFYLAAEADYNCRHDWMFRYSNWNAVCVAGVVVPALSVLPDRMERARILAIAEASIEEFYLSSFSGDGFGDEGLSYWNYGYSYFLLLNEAVDRATNGKLHWLNDTKVRNISEHPLKLHLNGGVYASYADSVMTEQPFSTNIEYLKAKYLPDYQQPFPDPAGIIDLFLTADRKLTPAEIPVGGFRPEIGRELRSWYPDGQYFISRGERMGASFKGGYNATPNQNRENSHKHLDLGSFEIALDGEKPLVDPGVMAYDATTFSIHRWNIPIHNSFGHNLPRLNGKTQREGYGSRAKLQLAEAADAEDRIKLDLTSVYNDPTLESFTREFCFSRANGGKLTITDRVRFSEPGHYEAGFLTYGSFAETEGGMTVTDKKAPLKVQFHGMGKFRITPEKIDVDMRIKRQLTRIGVSAEKAQKEFTVTTVFTPAK